MNLLFIFLFYKFYYYYYYVFIIHIYYIFYLLKPWCLLRQQACCSGNQCFTIQIGSPAFQITFSAPHWNKTTHSEPDVLQQQKLTVSQFWWPEAANQGLIGLAPPKDLSHCMPPFPTVCLHMASFCLCFLLCPNSHFI